MIYRAAQGYNGPEPQESSIAVSPEHDRVRPPRSVLCVGHPLVGDPLRQPSLSRGAVAPARDPAPGGNAGARAAARAAGARQGRLHPAPAGRAVRDGAHRNQRGSGAQPARGVHPGRIAGRRPGAPRRAGPAALAGSDRGIAPRRGRDRAQCARGVPPGPRRAGRDARARGREPGRFHRTAPRGHRVHRGLGARGAARHSRGTEAETASIASRNCASRSNPAVWSRRSRCWRRAPTSPRSSTGCNPMSPRHGTAWRRASRADGGWIS